MTKKYDDETICAIATPIGEGGISVIRVSGTQAFDVIQQVFRSKPKKDLKKEPSHTIHYGVVTDPVTSHQVDEVLVSTFKAPRSYTGEDVIEMSCHGGLATTRNVLKLISNAGARLAEPGEFTKRAFLNGKMDLAQAEAVLDVIRAKTDLSLQAAMQNLRGSLSASAKKIKDIVLKCTAHIEAYIDFPESDLEAYTTGEIQENLKLALQLIDHLVESFNQGALLREGVLLVVVGQPNVGKSSLLNAFLERDRAIVSDIPGTTRDTIEEIIDLKGIPVRLVDTAGVTTSIDLVEQMGVERTKQYIAEGDLFLWLLDGSRSLDAKDKEVLKLLSTEKVVIAINKSDLPQKLQEAEVRSLVEERPLLHISSKTREGMSELEIVLAEEIWSSVKEKPNVVVSKQRHVDALRQASKYLKSVQQGMVEKRSLELISVDLNEVLGALGELVGEIYSEDLLDVIFSEFCIGK